LEEFREYVKLANQPDLKRVLRDYIAHLSAHQQSQLQRAVLDFVNDRQPNADEKTQLEAALDEEMNVLGIGQQQENGIGSREAIITTGTAEPPQNNVIEEQMEMTTNTTAE
jgi:hypothetical protein